MKLALAGIVSQDGTHVVMGAEVLWEHSWKYDEDFTRKLFQNSFNTQNPVLCPVQSTWHGLRCGVPGW